MSNNPLVQSAFPIVVFGAVALSVVMSLIFLFSRGSTYDEIGDGGLMSGSSGGDGPPPLAPDSPAGRAERELEIRQMLSARSERLVGRGQPALDIDAEVARHQPAIADLVVCAAAAEEEDQRHHNRQRDRPEDHDRKRALHERIVAHRRLVRYAEIVD